MNFANITLIKMKTTHQKLNPNIQNAIRDIILIKLHDQVMSLNKELCRYKQENELLKHKLMSLLKNIIYDKTISKNNSNAYPGHRKPKSSYFPQSIIQPSNNNKKTYTRLSQSQINLSMYLSTDHNININDKERKKESNNDKDRDRGNDTDRNNKVNTFKDKNNLSLSQRRFKAFNTNVNFNNNNDSCIDHKSGNSFLLSDSMCNNTNNNISKNSKRITLKKDNYPLNDSREILLYSRDTNCNCNSNINSKRFPKTRNIQSTPCKSNWTNSTSNILSKSAMTSTDAKEPKEKQNQLIQIHRKVFSKSPFIRNKF